MARMARMRAMAGMRCELNARGGPFEDEPGVGTSLLGIRADRIRLDGLGDGDCLGASNERGNRNGERLQEFAAAAHIHLPLNCYVTRLACKNEESITFRRILTAIRMMSFADILASVGGRSVCKVDYSIQSLKIRLARN